MLCKHFSSGIAHDAPSYGSKHPQLQPGQEDDRTTDKSGDHQTASDRNLMKICWVVLGKPLRIKTQNWGTYLEENCPSSNGHLLDFGGSKSLPGWFGALI